jgi:hypothetical protein
VRLRSALPRDRAVDKGAFDVAVEVRQRMLPVPRVPCSFEVTGTYSEQPGMSWLGLAQWGVPHVVPQNAEKAKDRSEL